MLFGEKSNLKTYHRLNVCESYDISRAPGIKSQFVNVIIFTQILFLYIEQFVKTLTKAGSDVDIVSMI